MSLRTILPRHAGGKNTEYADYHLPVPRSLPALTTRRLRLSQGLPLRICPFMPLTIQPRPHSSTQSIKYTQHHVSV